MKFTKMQGLGNDYVYVNGFEERIENPSEMAVKVSNRNFGVGSDGLILINRNDVEADGQLSRGLRVRFGGRRKDRIKAFQRERAKRLYLLLPHYRRNARF